MFYLPHDGIHILECTKVGVNCFIDGYDIYVKDIGAHRSIAAAADELFDTEADALKALLTKLAYRIDRLNAIQHEAHARLVFLTTGGDQ